MRSTSSEASEPSAEGAASAGECGTVAARVTPSSSLDRDGGGGWLSDPGERSRDRREAWTVRAEETEIARR
jgi:hypothetical protein